MYKAIIVDDEPNIREGLRTIINWNESGFVIVGEAMDGVEALELFETKKPSLVVTDIKMPRMDGIILSRELKIKNPHVSILILSGHSDFSYAREALKCGVSNYLLKPVDTCELVNELKIIQKNISDRIIMEKASSSNYEELKNYFLIKLARGEYEKKEVERIASIYGVNLRVQGFRVILIQLDNYGEYISSLSGEDIQLKKFTAGKLISEIVEEYGNGHIFENRIGQFGILLAIQSSTTCREDISGLTEKIVNLSKRYLEEDITAGIGDFVKNYDEIKQSYLNAQRALERRFFSENTKVFFYEDFAQMNSSWSAGWKSTRLMEAVRHLDKVSILAEIELLFREFENSFYSLGVIQSILINIVTELQSVLEEYDICGLELPNNGHRLLETASSDICALKLKEYVVECCFTAYDCISSKKGSKKDKLVNEIIEYVNSHYNEEMNLKNISKMFFINHIYVGQLFKNEAGEYFHDYVNKIRVQNALRLLQEGKLAIGEISEMVGYKYHDHFYRNFRKIFGISPSEYRKR